jgi:predicted amidohydrolase
MTHIRYSVAACQTDQPNPVERREMRRNTERMLSMIDSAVAGAAPFLPVRLIVFPEFAHAAPVFATLAELKQKLAMPIPNEHTDLLERKAREHSIYIQSGSMLEVDPKWPGAVFNTTCLIGPEGILYKYRKVNTWIPYEVHTSPHDLEGYDEPLFPVADTEIGRIGCADLLRLAVPRSDPATGRQRRGSAVARLRLHGPVGRDRADGLVDDS